MRSNSTNLVSTVVIVFLCATSVAFAQIEPAKDAPRPKPPNESKKHFQLPDDVQIELLASEPLISDPSAIAFDEHGRLYVCELHGYNLDGYLDIVELNKTGKLDRKIRRVRTVSEASKKAAEKGTYGTIKLLSDTDGDGRMDHSVVWADRLPACYGMVPARGGMIVVGAPDIIFLADRDGDGVAESRETLFTGFSRTHIERGINCPQWGLDNWIYVAAGGGGGQITGPHLKNPVQIGHTDFRIKPDGSAIEPVTGTTSTFGQTQNDLGDRFIARGPAAYAIPLAHRYLVRNPYVPSPDGVVRAVGYNRVFPVSKMHPWRTARGRNPAWVKFYGQRETSSGYFTSECGPLIYRSDLLPKRLHGNYFICEPSQNLIHRCLLQRDGAGYKGSRAAGEEESEFLTSTDQWFRPMNLSTGPDGAIYIVDMYREIIEDFSAIPRYLQQQYGLVQGKDHGRIWRLVPRDRSKSSVQNLATTATCVKALSSKNAWLRETARRLLIERQDKSVVGQLSELSREATETATQINALSALDGMGALSALDVERSLADKSYSVRVHALRLSEPLLVDNDALLANVVAMTCDDDLRVRLQLALTLGESRDPRAIDALSHLATHHGNERWMSAAILSSAGDTSDQLIARLLKASKTSGGVTSLLRALASSVGARRNDTAVGRLLVQISEVKSEPSRLALLDGLVEGLSRGNRSELKSKTGQQAIGELLAHFDPKTGQRILKIAGLLKLNDSPAMQATWESANKIALDFDRDEKDRAAAISVLHAAPWSQRAKLAALLNSRQPLALQLATVGAVSSGDADEVSDLLLAGYQGLSPKMQEAVIDAHFARRERIPKLLDAMKRGVVAPASLNGLRRAQLLETSDKKIGLLARRLLVSASTDDRAKVVESYRPALKLKRDIKRGKLVFERQCSKCHRLKEVGFAVGPDLAGAKNRADASLLIDVLDPSCNISPGYSVYTISTGNGKIFNGVLSSESATSLTLRREKGQTYTILRKDIEEVAASSRSLMPDGIEKEITPQDLADLIGYLRESLGPVVPPGIVLFEDEPSLIDALKQGGGSLELVRTDPFSGKAALRVTPLQRHSPRIPGWNFRIVESPAVDAKTESKRSYRYMRFAWKSDGGHGVMIELAASGSWPASDSPVRRYYSGKNSTKWQATQVSPDAPTRWTVVTVDLWKDFGEFNLTGIAPTALGGPAMFDRIELLHTLDVTK